MTPDQKRAHLVLCGLHALRFKSGGTGIETAVRIVSDDRRKGCLQVAYLGRGAWMHAKDTLSTPDRYIDLNFTDIPDELLDRLDLSLIEQFLSLDHSTD